MEEITSEQISSNIEQNNVYFGYFFTPLCGTCQLAAKMLNVITEMFADLPIHKCNLNYAASFGEELKIESVPCLIIWQNQKIVEKIYAFHSVHYLYDMVKKYWKIEGAASK
ncbi:thioredoxin family protein [Bacillus sp. Marseille-P3661]|uniref:thioredoxin family protein n=1 Tax=Bacillus sp. Marseille-P3661 TaxID=1936234 RepID=UPI000C852ED4|nr:thioredoxin family protein [Bacillus sp. Marseille-P3661]